MNWPGRQPRSASLGSLTTEGSDKRPLESGWALKGLGEIEDVAAKRDPSGSRQTRFPGSSLGLSQIGMSHQVLGEGIRQPFGHSHSRVEELVYVVAGSGRAKLDDEVIELTAGDLLRIHPEVVRAFEGEDEGIELVIFSQKTEADEVEIVRDWWQD